MSRSQGQRTAGNGLSCQCAAFSRAVRVAGQACHPEADVRVQAGSASGGFDHRGADPAARRQCPVRQAVPAAGLPCQRRSRSADLFSRRGWYTGDLPGYDVLCRELANQSGAAVLSVDYRLAPEHRFPAAVHDASLAFEWSTENASLLGVDAERIALGGDSAGGNLAIVAALEARDRAARMPRALALIYPSTQIHSERSSRETLPTVTSSIESPCAGSTSITLPIPRRRKAGRRRRCSRRAWPDCRRRS